MASNQTVPEFSSIRTLLFTPANRPERFVKARESGADGIVIDLEDAIALSGKDEARKIAIDYFKSHRPDPKFVQALRINSIKTAAGLKDLSALIDNNVRPDALMLPKVEYAAEITILNLLLQAKPIKYIVLIETAVGLRNSEEIAKASSNVGALVFGGADLAADIGAVMEWEPLLTSRCQIIRAAAGAGIPALDVPYLHLKDPDDSGVIAETKRVKALGFSGKLAIHPKHVKPILDTFAPTAEEVERARSVVSSYESAQGNASEIDGKMIDLPVYRSAKRILAIGV